MKNSLKYFGLWQKKRSELHIDDDPQTDWQHMQKLLDRHLPVEDAKPSRSKGFKLMSVLFVSMSAAAMTYVVSNVIEIKKHKHGYTNEYHHKHKVIPGIYSISNDSIQNQNAATPKKDSLMTAKSSAGLQNSGLVNPGATKNNVVAKSSTVASPATSVSALSATDAVTAVKSGALRKKNNLTTITARNNKRQAGDFTNNRQVASYNKGNTPKFAGPRGIGGRYGAAHNAFINNSALIPGRANSRTNHNIINGTNEAGNTHSVSGKIDSVNMPPYPTLLSLAPMAGLKQYNNFPFIPIATTNVSITPKSTPLRKQQGDKSDKAGKSSKTKSAVLKNSTPSNIDWGLLTGVNSSGSFTPKSQNSNFYGSPPVDLYFGLYGTYNLNNNWGINMQIKLFSPQTITTNYSHANGSKVDSGQTLQIVNSGKFYSVSVPVRAMYKINNNISFVGGPVINFPVKQVNIKSSLLPAGIKADSTYYAKTINLLNGTTYQQSLNFGITGGVNFQFKRLSFEASWLRSLSGYQAISSFGSGRSYNSTFQFTIGFQLSKVKP